jgi:spermidine synthase
LMHIDGIKWVKEYQEEKYDLIICDSTDPTDTGKALFTDSFYSNCSRILNNEGLFVCQGESLYYEDTKKASLRTFKYLKKYFFKNWMYQAYIPTYSSGHWMYNFASKKDIDPIDSKIKEWNKLGIKTKYYNTDVHIGSFALPNYIIEILNKIKVK